MNHVFRLVWNESLNSYVPAAETVRGRGKSSKRKLIAVALSLSAGMAQAGPTGGQVTVGAGAITQSGTTTTIRQAGQNLSLTWKSFNIGPQETVDFVQPSATSIAVNRIFDVNGTQILGHLDANGQVYLINPNGIVFGKGAQVDVGGLVASTLNLNDSTFGTDTKTFSGAGSGSIVNNGTITAGSGGYVALLANTVINQGTISAQLGSVALGAGRAATLTFAGSHLVHMQVDQSVLNALAENTGVIRADGGQILMTAGAKDALLASVVNNTGVIEAYTVENRGGSIALTGGPAGQVVVAGTLDASSATGEGGEIVATGETVLVGNGARVAATGATGGGSIAIGGGWEGGGGIAQATAVYVSKTATLDASATGPGNGGEVVVRSAVNDPDSATRVYGTLLAQGADGGNGGRIETSGHWLDVTGIMADASAPSGRAGEWLLDPYNVIIGSTTSGNGYTPPNFSPTSSDSTILASTISTALTGGSNVTITTGSSGSSLGDITVSTAITKTAGAATTLTLQAADSIIISQPISNTSATGALNVNLWADNDNGTHDGVGVVILNSSITTAGGAIAFGTNATQAINGVSTLVGGDVYVGGTSAVTLSTSGGAINLYGQLIVANSGGFSLNSANGSVKFGGLVDSGDAYAFVSYSGISWTNALTAAKSGIGANTGDTYLATITSRLENAVAGADASYQSSWLGAERVTGLSPNTDAVWRWVTGPEGLQNGGQGLKFFTQNGSDTSNGSSGTAIGTSYTNWNSGEPNNNGGANLSASGLGEWVMQFTGSQGQWNDLSPTNTTGILGYVKETNLAPSALTVTAGTGAVTFAGAIGSNKSLSTLAVTANTIALPSSATVNTTGAQTFTTPTGQVSVGGINFNLLTVSATNLNTTYGLGVPTLGTPTYSGFVNGNTVASLTTASTESTTATAQPNAGSYPIALSTAVDSSYYILYNPGTLVVNLATINVTASSATKTYRGANPALTVSYPAPYGLQYSDTASSVFSTQATASTTATTASNAGAYPTTASGAVLSSSNYTIAYVPGTLTVNPAPLTVSGFAGTGRTYNGLTSDTLTGTGTLSGLLNGETLTLANTTTGMLAGTNVGSEGVTSALTLVSGTGLATNYTLTQPTLANVTITAAPLTVIGLVGTPRTYNGLTSDTLTGGTLSGLQNGETLTLGGTTSGTLASANAGSEPLTTTVSVTNGTGLASNYALTQPTLANVTITAAPLTVTGLAGTGRTYNGLTADTLTGTGVLAGLQISQTLTLANTTTGTLASANAGSEAVTTALTLVAGTGSLSNYSLTQPTLAPVTITPAPLTVTGLAGTGRAYNGLTADTLAGTGVLAGLQNSETMTLANTTTGTLASANVGSEAVTTALTLVAGTGSLSNYALTQPTLAPVTITAAPLTVTGLAGTGRAYNGLTADTLTGTGVLVGLQNSQTLTLGTVVGTLASPNAGSEAVTTALTLVAGTGSLSNYSLTQPTLSSVTITAAPLTVIGLSGTPRTYNGLTSDALTGGTLSGLQNGETLTLGGTTSGTLASANAGSEPVTTTVSVTNGTGLASNYALTQPTLANVAIAQAPLTVTGLAGTPRTYNGLTSDALTGGTLSGLQNGETLTLGGTTSGTLASANAGSEPLTTTVSVNNGTGLASNYALTQPTLANVAIGQAPLTVTGLVGTPRTYNGLTSDTLTGGALSGLQNGETLSLVNAATGTLASANAGSEPLTAAITLTNGTGGGLASNYTLTQPTLANVTITPAPLTIIGTVASDKVYDRTTTATLTSGNLSGVFSGDNVTLTQAGSFASRDVGTGIAVTAADTLGGTAGPNYLLTQPTGLTANITPKELGLNLSGNPTRVYDGTTIFGFTGYTTTLSGVIVGDAVNVGAGSVTGYGDKNAGADKAITFTGFALSGPSAADYQLVSGAATSTASITPATIGLVTGITANNKVYDGGTGATLNNASAVFTGEIRGDSLTVVADTGSFASKNVATGVAVGITGITLGGTDASNYLLGNTTASSTANITQLASVAWIGPATGGSWSNPANWAGGAIPDLSNVANVVVPPGDTVKFDSSVAGPVNLSNLSSGGLDLTGGTLNVASALNLTNYAQTGGTLGGPGNFTVIGAFIQTAGQINMGPGSVAIDQLQGNLSFANIAGGAVNLASAAGSVTLGTLAASSNLAVTAGGGGITQSTGAALAVGGTTTLQASDAGVPADISLTNASNTFAAPVSASGAQVRLTDAGPLTLGTVAATGDLTLASTGALDLGTSTVGGNLAANSGNGNVTQDGPLAVTGTTGIVAGTGNIDLSNARNTLAQAVSASGAAIRLTDAGPLTLDTVAATGNLTLASTGALDLGTSTVGGNLAANSGNGNVTQDGPLAVTGTTGIVAGTGNIDLSNARNTLAQAVSASGAAIRLTDAGPLTLGTVAATGNLTVASTGALDLGTSTVGGNLAANSGNGNVTQDGPLAVTGTTGIVAGTGNIQLKNIGNAFGGKVTTSGSQISLTDAGSLALGTVAASGNLNVASSGALDLGTSSVGGNLAANSGNGNVTQDGPLTVTGTTGIAAGTGTIQLNNPGNALNGKLTTTGGNVSIVGQTTESAANATVISAVSQLESSMFGSDITTQPGEMSQQSPSFNEVPVTGSAASATANPSSGTSSSTASGNGALVNVTLTVGVNGPALKIVNGGVRLPNQAVSVNE